MLSPAKCKLLVKDDAEKLLEKLEVLVGVKTFVISVSDSRLDVEPELELLSMRFSVSNEDMLNFFLSRKWILFSISLVDLLGSSMDNSMIDNFLETLDRIRLSSSVVQVIEFDKFTLGEGIPPGDENLVSLAVIS